MNFAKHETFHIRDGWLHKGLQAVAASNKIFLEDEAPEILGLGKNMVRSLRYWMQATGLSSETIHEGKRVQTLTQFGQLVFQFDPYQELDGTIWLIHYKLASNHELATTWYWFFNHYIPVNFTQDDFIKRLGNWITIRQKTEAHSVAEGSLRKDLSCLLNTYLPAQRSKSPEDLIESPLSALGLLSSFKGYDDEKGRTMRSFRLETPSTHSIPPLVFLYVLLQSQEIERPTARQVGLNVALREPANVGRIFNVGISGLESMLTKLADRFPDYRVHLSRTGGLDQLTLPNATSEVVLEYFYENQAIEEEIRVWSRHLS
jgi:hypothetical protein